MTQPKESATLRTRLPLETVQGYSTPAAERAGLLRLDINESPTGAPDFVVEATHRALGAHQIATYPAYGEWCQQAAAWFEVAEDCLTCTAGADEGLKAIFDTFLLPGRALVTPTPGFSMFQLWAGLLGNPVRAVPLKRLTPARLVFEPEAWFGALNPGGSEPPTGLVAIATPNNPTGTVVDRAQIIETLNAVKCPVIIDETYAEFIGLTVSDLIAEFPHLFVTRSFSKVYGLAGLRIGVVLSQPQNIAALRKVLNPFNVNRAAIAASSACMARPRELRASINAMKAVRGWFVRQLQSIGVPTGEAHANFVLAHFGDNHDQIVEALRGEDILVKGHHGKHELLSGCVRIGIGGQAQMRRCMGAIRKHLQPPPALRAVLLDMDGTLVDVARSCRKAIIDTTNTFLEAPNEPVDAEIVDQFKARGGLNNDWDCVEAILAERGVTVERQAVIDRFQEIYRGADFDGAIRDEPWLLSAADEATLRARYTLGVVTGRPRDEALFTLSLHGGPWPVVVGLEDMAQQKPAPDGLQRALSALELEAGPDVVYVGDSVDDMRAAKAAGCRAAGVLAPGKLWSSGWPERLYQAGADWVFQDITEVVRWLSR